MSSTGATSTPDLLNYVQGEWQPSATTDYVAVVNPATAELLARTPLSTAADVEAAVQSAAQAFPSWRRTPPGERIQYLFKLKNLLEEHLGEIARLITLENGKTLAEAKAEIRRGIENVEVACGIPMMMQGYNLEDVTPGVDETLIRQPLGVVAAITPFNFPAMIPFWFLPYAIACGNTLVLKPSERVPLTMRRVMELLENDRVAARRGEPGEWRARCGRRSVRSPAGAGHQLCGLHAGGQARLCACRSQWEAHAVPGRREKSRDRAARRGYGIGHANYQRQRVWMRRAALPGGVGGGNGGRCAKKFSRFDQPRGFIFACWQWT